MGGDQGWGLDAGRGGGNMVGEESDWKVGSPRARIVAADGIPLSRVTVGECASGGGRAGRVRQVIHCWYTGAGWYFL